MLESAQSTAPASNFKHLGREPPQSGAHTSAAVPRLRRIPQPPAERQPDASTDRPPEGLGGRVDIRAGDRFTPGQRRSPAPRQGYAQPVCRPRTVSPARAARAPPRVQLATLNCTYLSVDDLVLRAAIDRAAGEHGGPEVLRYEEVPFPCRGRGRCEAEAAKAGVTVSSAQVRSNGAQLAELGRRGDCRDRPWTRPGRPGGDSRARAVRHGWAQPWGRMTARPLTFPACRRS